EKFDAVFSNAVLHWIKAEKHAQVLSNIKKHLKPEGRLVVEMGGARNVATVVNGIKAVLHKNGYKEQANRHVWYFPKPEEYGKMLKKAGFTIDFIKLIDRPTPVNSDKGLKNWLKMFGEKWIEGIDKSNLNKLLEEIEQELTPKLYKNGSWVADYKRLRFSAKCSQ